VVPSSVTVPANIGVRGLPLSDSSTSQILDALRAAVTTPVVVVALEDGNAWWETRLLVLCAGAVRRGRPEAIVFTATLGEAEGVFLGWATPASLLAALLRTRDDYASGFGRARSANAQVELVNPVGQPMDAPPPVPLASLKGLAHFHLWVGTDPSAPQRPNEFAFEQFLAMQLGETVEQQGPPVISVIRLHELFDPVLHEAQIDDRWSESQRLEAFLSSEQPYIALTSRGRYVGLLNHRAGTNAVLASLTRRDRT
jgi:hypothetical protein